MLISLSIVLKSAYFKSWYSLVQNYVTMAWLNNQVDVDHYSFSFIN